MKRKLLVLLALCLLCVGAAQAAQWQDGRSAAQPYADVPAVDLSQTMGYIMRYPREKLPATTFCDRLTLYLPREDVRLGQGTLTLYEDGEAAATLPFDDPRAVTLRAMSEDELEALIWGGGVCVEVRLPESLRFGEEYYVLMDEGCLLTEGGVSSPAITSPDAWKIQLGGDYGVSGLRYEDADEDGADKTLRFDLALGGEAASATLYSEDDSVTFEKMEYDQSGEIVGTVTGDAPSWGVVFLDGDGNPLDQVAAGD